MPRCIECAGVPCHVEIEKSQVQPEAESAVRIAIIVRRIGVEKISSAERDKAQETQLPSEVHEICCRRFMELFLEINRGHELDGLHADR